jgi:hypothetical protein
MWWCSTAMENLCRTERKRPEQSEQCDNDKVKAAIQTVTDRMQSAHATLYLIDPEGVVARDPGNPDSLGSGMPGDAASGYGAYSPGLGFENFVSTTGGRIFAGRNDIDAEIGQRLLKARNITRCRMCQRVQTMLPSRVGRSWLRSTILRCG